MWRGDGGWRDAGGGGEWVGSWGPLVADREERERPPMFSEGAVAVIKEHSKEVGLGTSTRLA
jgi:hypothetical protein